MKKAIHVIKDGVLVDLWAIPGPALLKNVVRYGVMALVGVNYRARFKKIPLLGPALNLEILIVVL
jgi:hypothetical protein